jgi:hypothetical protein
MRLRLLESSIASRFKVSPKIRTDATFDFCNSIGAKRTRDKIVRWRARGHATKLSSFSVLMNYLSSGRNSLLAGVREPQRP